MLILDSGDFLLDLGSIFWSWFTSTSIQTSFPPRNAFCAYLSIKLGWFRYYSFLGEKSWTNKLLHRERFTTSVEILQLTQFFMHFAFVNKELKEASKLTKNFALPTETSKLEDWLLQRSPTWSRCQAGFPCKLTSPILSLFYFYLIDWAD